MMPVLWLIYWATVMHAPFLMWTLPEKDRT